MRYITLNLISFSIMIFACILCGEDAKDAKDDSYDSEQEQVEYVPDYDKIFQEYQKTVEIDTWNCH